MNPLQRRDKTDYPPILKSNILAMLAVDEPSDFSTFLCIRTKRA
jgi:hypothetical protein